MSLFKKNHHKRLYLRSKHSPARRRRLEGEAEHEKFTINSYIWAANIYRQEEGGLFRTYCHLVVAHYN